MKNSIYKRAISIGTIMFALFLLIGCESQESSNLRTAGIYANIDATANQYGVVDVNVQLTMGPLSNTVVDLSDGDTLSASARGIQKLLQKNKTLLGDITYETSISAGNDAGTKVQVMFDRREGVSATNSYAYLPPPFNIEAPASGTSYSDTEQVSIVWNPETNSRRSMTISAINYCAGGESKISLPSVRDSSGIATFSASSLVPTNLAAGTVCDVRIVLSRVQSGVVDSNFDGGTFTIDQTRNVDIKVAIQ